MRPTRTSWSRREQPRIDTAAERKRAPAHSRHRLRSDDARRQTRLGRCGERAGCKDGLSGCLRLLWEGRPKCRMLIWGTERPFYARTGHAAAAHSG